MQWKGGLIVSCNRGCCVKMKHLTGNTQEPHRHISVICNLGEAFQQSIVCG